MDELVDEGKAGGSMFGGREDGNADAVVSGQMKKSICERQ
jgi:hypothetical protein